MTALRLVSVLPLGVGMSPLLVPTCRRAFSSAPRISNSSTSRQTIPSTSSLQCSPRSTLRRLHVSTRVEARPTDHHPGRGESRESTADMLNRLEREARQRTAEDAREYVGPFPLGVGPSGRRKAWKSWTQLGLGGKMARATVQSGNLMVILIGGGLFVILAIALSTELFAKNSPSVLYSECIDMIRDTDALDLLLLPPLSFTHTPHSSAPSRGSAPVVHRAVRHPTSGRDHLVLTFWVHGRGKDEPEPLGWAKSWLRSGEDVLRKAGSWVGLAANPAGDELAPSPSTTAPEPEEPEPQGPGFFGRMVQGLSLRPGPAARRATVKLSPPGTYKVGEVRADYVKNASGQYVMLSLVVDVPSARAPYPGRAVVYWSPEADREGLVERR